MFKPNLVQSNDSPSLIVQRLLLVHVWASILYNHQITATKRPQAPEWLLKVCRNTIGKVAGSPHEEQPRRNFKEIIWDSQQIQEQEMARHKLKMLLSQAQHPQSIQTTHEQPECDYQQPSTAPLLRNHVLPYFMHNWARAAKPIVIKCLECARHETTTHHMNT